MNNVIDNLVVFPIIIPLLAGILLFFLRSFIPLQRWVIFGSTLLLIVISGTLMHRISIDGIQTLQVGGWEAPFGISLVADMFSALLVLTTSIITLACLAYAFQSMNRGFESHYLYPFIMFLVCGVNGSFITGDMFNLFVFFEVMLIASYVLLTLGGSKPQLRESIKYILINIISSMLFIIAIGYLYAITGTLNMAHLSERVAEIGQDGLITTVSLLFLIVFGLKSALFLYFWLPGSYSVPAPAIAALFAALLTKVGVYAIFRTFTLIFYHRPEITHTVILYMSVAAMILGALGAISQWNVRKILAYNIIIAVGFIVFGLGTFNDTAMSGSLFYLINDMLAKAFIFILGGTMIRIARTDHLQEMGGLIRHHPFFGWMFLLAALTLAGVPPLSGFVGKIMVLQGGFDQELYWMTGISLATSLLILFSVMKIFINGFWGQTSLSEDEKGSSKEIIFPSAILASLILFLGFGAEWMLIYIEDAVSVLSDPALYVDAVLGRN